MLSAQLSGNGSMGKELNLTINTGVNIVGSKNVVVFNGGRGGVAGVGQGIEEVGGRKRRAEEVSLLCFCLVWFLLDVKERVCVGVGVGA